MSVYDAAIFFQTCLFGDVLLSVTILGLLPNFQNMYFSILTGDGHLAISTCTNFYTKFSG